MKWNLESSAKALKADAPKTGWWKYGQNNSGGSFDHDGGHATYIWAAGVAEANRIAEANGIYFDGCDKGRDCRCCGDRWSTPWDDEDPEHPPISVAELVEQLTKTPEVDPRWPSLAKSDLAYAAQWGLGIRIIDKDGDVLWLRAVEP